jgi:hypothetical protein
MESPLRTTDPGSEVPGGSPARRLRWLLLAAALHAGCAHASSLEADAEQPPRTDTRFENLSMILAGIPRAGNVLLYEGLPGNFWEPDLRERELRRKKTIRIHGYPFYEELLTFEGTDADPLTSLLAATDSFRPYGGLKPCGDFYPDYCVEWKTGEEATQALICLECGEVKMYGPRSELHCDLSGDAAQRLRQLLDRYQKNRP